MAIHVGIGSWADDEYVGVLYPEKTPAGRRLSGYTKHFNFVELNSTYYAAPKPAVVEKWIQDTPAGFIFNVKLHRLFSQSPKTAAGREPLLQGYRDAVTALKMAKRFGVYFLVLPPSFTADRHRLEELDGLTDLFAPDPIAVELRDRAWVEGEQCEKTLDYFSRKKLILIGVDFAKIPGSRLLPAVDEVTNPKYAYLRLHGRNKKYLEAETAAEGHTYLYSDEEIDELAQRAKKLAKKADEVFVVANNHAHDYAPRSALALKAKLTV